MHLVPRDVNRNLITNVTRAKEPASTTVARLAERA